jgi:hypothetical protein
MEKENILMLMDQLIKVIGCRIKDMETDNIHLFVSLGHLIKENGNIIREVVKDIIIPALINPLYRSIMEILMIEKIMEKENNVIQMNRCIKAIGRMMK